MNSQFKSLSFLSATLLLAACGGGGGDTAATNNLSNGTPAAKATAQGVFKDSNVSGMKYVSGSVSGVTDAQGRFTYEVGEKVKFFIGGIELGSALGGDVVTPLDLVEGAEDTENREVKNMVKLFMLVDKDKNPNNGINIDEQLQGLAENWQQIDLSEADIAPLLASVQSDIASLGRNTDIPSDADAKKHYSSTLSCLYSGAFTGSREGNPYAFVFNAKDGSMSGYTQAKINGNPIDFDISSAAPVAYKRKPILKLDNVNLTTNVASGPFTITTSIDAKFKTPNKISGTWTSLKLGEALPGVSEFKGERLGNNGRIKHRISGLFKGEQKGAFEINFNGSKKAKGYVFSMQDGKKYPLVGTLSGNKLVLSAEGAKYVFTGTLSNDMSSLKGSWTLPGDITGDFEGSGCVSENKVVDDYCALLEGGVELSENVEGTVTALKGVLANTVVQMGSTAVISGVFGGVAVPLGDINRIPGRYKISGNALTPLLETATAAVKVNVGKDCSGLACSNLAHDIVATAINNTMTELSYMLNDQLSLDYSCSDNQIKINGAFGFSASGAIKDVAGFIDVGVKINASGNVSNATYNLGASPAGGIWLTKAP